jgi:capsular exopolysaccharide synthesis family protein
LNEVAVVAMSKATNIQIVDRAVYPQQPFKPNKRLDFILSIVFGLIGGIGLAFTVEYFDNITVKDTQEIEKGMQIPTLGMIPLEDRLNGESRIRIVHSDISNPISEAFRSISTIIYLSSSSSRPPKSILVTSPGEKEGKTTSCINIASALAESLGKGIIVDADLRKPRLHDSFELNNEIGLSTYLSGGVEFGGMDGRLIRPTALKGLHIMSAGPVPANPAELLFSDRMKDLLNALHTMYNFAIIDAPPLLGMSDSVFLSTIVDGTVLVVKAGETPRSVIEESKRMLNSVHAKLLGVVLNGVKKGSLKYDYGYYSHYSSSYTKE